MLSDLEKKLKNDLFDPKLYPEYDIDWAYLPGGFRFYILKNNYRDIIYKIEIFLNILDEFCLRGLNRKSWVNNSLLFKTKNYDEFINHIKYRICSFLKEYEIKNL
jgi:hypothetical protein